MKKLSIILLTFLLVFSMFSCTNTNGNNIYEEYPDATIIKLNKTTATVNGEAVNEYDYTWHVDPSVAHDEVKNAPAEYYTGTKCEDEDIYIDHELYYYPELDTSLFKLVNYDGENEWAYYYTDGVNNDYIFATLPNLNNKLPETMMHSEEDALENKVLHITKEGTYILEGEWDGQIYIDLGDEDENFTDETKKVTVILNGVDITCTVAPGIIFCDLYECDNTWEDKESYSNVVDTTNAGVNVIIADNTENNVTGENVFRMLKTKYKDEDSTDAIKLQKKQRKTDAAFYSYVSMNINSDTKGTGTLNVTSGFEGLDSELHLTINGGNITINSQDDGMNVNEDNVSVLTINGGTVTLNPALGAEGDGIDSNGYVTMNGGTLNVNGVRVPDSAIDTEDGFYYNDGTITIDGETQNYTKGTVIKEGMGMGQGQMPTDGNNPLNQDFDIQDFKEKVASLSDDATLDDVLKLLGMNQNNGDMQKPDDGNFTPGTNPPTGDGNTTPPDLPAN